MDIYKNSARIVGAFFLTAMVTYLLGASMIESFLIAPDYLAIVSENGTLVVFGVLLELTNCIAVVGIAVTIYPIFRRHNEAAAMGYVSFRIIEAALLVVAALSPLVVLTLSQEYITAGAADAASFQSMGTVLINARAHLAGVMLTTFFSLGALLLYYFLYQTKLVPRWLSVWGLIAAVLVLTWNLLEAFGFSISAGLIFGLPIILNEITLGIWLIVKGFNPDAVENLSA
jgi:hypothetical protein